MRSRFIIIGTAVYVAGTVHLGWTPTAAFLVGTFAAIGVEEAIDRLDHGGRGHGRADRREQTAIDRAHQLYRAGEIDEAELDRQIDDALRSEERHRIRRAMDDVPHVGGETADALWARFEILEGVERASEDELEAVNGVGESRAASIRERFQ